MANTAVSGTLFCSDGTEIPLYVAAIAEGTESNLTTSTQSNFTVSAAAVGTAYAGKTIVSSTPIMADGDGNTSMAYAYLLRAGQIINVFPVAVAGVVGESKIQLCSSTTLIAGDQVRVLANTNTNRTCAMSVYTNRGQYHVFTVTPSGGAVNELTSILTGNGIGDTFQGQNIMKGFVTSIDQVKLAPSGMGVYVVNDRNAVVGAFVATHPLYQQALFSMVNIPIGLNFQAQAITSA